MDMSVGNQIVGVVSLLAILFLFSRGMPGSRWPIILLATLAVIVLVVAADRYGMWPEGWSVRR